MRTGRLGPAAVERLYRRANAHRWQLPLAAFAQALERSVQRMFPHGSADPRQLDRFLISLHLEDLALACACAEGSDVAWEHFVREFRPGVTDRRMRSILRVAHASLPTPYTASCLVSPCATASAGRTFSAFHGRSSLATWLRAVLAQRHVDRLRDRRRSDPLPADDAPDAVPMPAESVNPRWRQYLDLVTRVLAAAIARLAPRERLRLRCYYAQDLTLAQIGTVLGEHEATVSRGLARTRRTIRMDVETALRQEHRMSDAEIDECLAAVVENTGSLDIADVLLFGD